MQNCPSCGGEPAAYLSYSHTATCDIGAREASRHVADYDYLNETFGVAPFTRAATDAERTLWTARTGETLSPEGEIRVFPVPGIWARQVATA